VITLFLHSIIYGSNGNRDGFFKTVINEEKAAITRDISEGNNYNLSKESLNNLILSDYRISSWNQRLTENVESLKHAITAKDIVIIMSKRILTFSWPSILNSIILLNILSAVFILCCLTVFIYLPNEWTLINHKVRLDD
jgi:hypothetical protein